MKSKKKSKSPSIAASPIKAALPASLAKKPAATAPKAVFATPVAAKAPQAPSIVPPVKLPVLPAKVVAAPQKAAVAPTKPLETIISVKVDVGFGNQVYLRGEGPGLSWEKGVPADNAASDLWTIALKDAAKPVRFKVLVNDAMWSTGEDYEVEPGQKITFTPRF